MALVNKQPGAAAAAEGTQPGLNEKVVPGSFTEFDAWLFDGARKAGDATVIENAEGCKVVYLSSQNTTDYVWKTEITDKFVQEDYEAYVMGLHEQYPLGYHGIGMRYAMTDAQKMCDAYMVLAASQGGGQFAY